MTKPSDPQNGILRLIVHEPLAGVENMAIDEAILEAVGAGQSPPTLRFYQWDQPTISLGYFQKIAEWQQQDRAIRQLPLVRRKTGGGAILHDDELTYSLTLPLHQGLPITEIQSMYKLVHGVCIATLAKSGFKAVYRNEGDRRNSQRGPFFCFDRRHGLDLVMDGKKLMGSAQRRTKNACLQHGSLIIGRHFEQQPSSSLTAQKIGSFDLSAFIDKVAEQVSHGLDLKMIQGELNDQENQSLKTHVEKYLSKEWTWQR